MQSLSASKPAASLPVDTAAGSSAPSNTASSRARWMPTAGAPSSMVTFASSKLDSAMPSQRSRLARRSTSPRAATSWSRPPAAREPSAASRALRVEAEPAQGGHAVVLHGEPGADLADLIGALEDQGLEARPPQGYSRRQAAHAAADDEDRSVAHAARSLAEPANAPMAKDLPAPPPILYNPSSARLPCPCTHSSTG